MRSDTDPMPAPLLARLCDAWSVMHRDLPVQFVVSDLHYLTHLALAVDGDLIAHLLLRKLRMARIADPGDLPPQVARLGSRVEFTHGEQAGSGILVHPTRADGNPGRISIAGAAGSGLVGLRAGSSLLWPTAAATLETLRLERVTCAGPGSGREGPGFGSALPQFGASPDCAGTTIMTAPRKRGGWRE